MPKPTKRPPLPTTVWVAWYWEPDAEMWRVDDTSQTKKDAMLCADGIFPHRHVYREYTAVALPDAPGKRKGPSAWSDVTKWGGRRQYAHTSGAEVWRLATGSWRFSLAGEDASDGTTVPTLAAAKRLALGGKAGRK